eukprot:RCo036777
MGEKVPRTRARKGSSPAVAAAVPPSAALPLEAEQPASPLGRLLGTTESKLLDAAVGPTPAAQRDFALVSVLGKGAFGKVFKALRRTDQKVFAVKIMKKDALEEKDAVEWVERERDVLAFLAKLQHPFVVRAHHFFENQAVIGFALDFLTGGDLGFHLARAKGRRFDLPQAQFYFAVVALALDFLHHHRVIYRDLKPANLLLNSAGYPVLADFGFAEVVPPSQDRLDDFCGSPDYVSPEMIHCEEGGYGFEVDWWAAGVMLYEFLSGAVPWSHPCEVTQYEMICRNPPRRRTGVTSGAWNLLTAMLHKKLEGRAHGLDALKTFQFLDDVDWDGLANHTVPPPFTPCVGEDDTANFEPILTMQKPVVSTTKPAGKSGGGVKKNGKHKK